MNFLHYLATVKSVLKNHPSCSLVNSEGTLLFSKDAGPELLTTSRLVAFQIIKKYLNPGLQDLFVMNDPENGGYQHSKLIFLSCLTPNLFLIWDEEYPAVDFRIPPTPLFEKGQRNEFVWQALVAAHPQSADLESFILWQKEKSDRIARLESQVDFLANLKNQQNWLKATQEIFNLQFTSKAQGSFESQYRLATGQLMKLRFSSEEKQNMKLITLDFTNTAPATTAHIASHVTESALVKRIAEFYQLTDFFTQSILDKIKVILPPKSLVSKPHQQGAFNFELQNMVSQLCDFCMLQLNSHARKSQSQFEYVNLLAFDISGKDGVFSKNLVSPGSTHLQNFEKLISAGLIRMKKMKRSDNNCHLAFHVASETPLDLRIKNDYVSDATSLSFKLNDKKVGRGLYQLGKGDVVEITAG